MTTLHDEVMAIRENTPILPLFEEQSLIEGYENLLAKGLVKPRGFTLQTIDEMQRDALDAKIVYAEFR
ncbi:MAG: hypothetical protein LBE35_01095 [Clostridiales bacterium]|jgi:hypothetical protein|nr:hypothetical protein [Clostridiales bacterium]